jgi:hypothetical protein
MFGGTYSQPEDIRAAVWDKAMKEGIYRVAVVVTEVRSIIPLETRLRFIDLASNSTSQKTAVVVSTVAWTQDLATSAITTSRESPTRWDKVTVPKQSLWNWNSTTSTVLGNGTHVT